MSRVILPSTLRLPDLEEAMSKTESLGGSRVVGPMDVPDGLTIVMFADPEGHQVGLLKAGSTRS